MAEHDELIAEMPMVLQMTAENRIRHARQRRNQQLSKWIRMESAQTPEDLPTTPKVMFYAEEVLLDAVQRGDVAEVEQIMSKGISPNISNSDGFTAIHQCSLGDRADILEILIKNGANVNIEDNDGWTPLHAAFACGRLAIIELLVDRGANLLALDHEMNFPFEVSNDDETIGLATKLLSQKGISGEKLESVRQVPENEYLDRIKNQMKMRPEINVAIERVDELNATHLHIAAAYNFARVTDFLLSIGAKVDSQDRQNWTPLHVASYFTQQRIIEKLIRAGANPEKMTDRGLNAFDLCCDYDLKQWMFDLISLNRKNDTRRRKTLPIRESDPFNARPYQRRYSLRESKKHKKHDDDFHYVISAKLLGNEKNDEDSNNSVDSLDNKSSPTRIELTSPNPLAVEQQQTTQPFSARDDFNRPLIFETDNHKRSSPPYKCCLIL